MDAVAENLSKGFGITIWGQKAPEAGTQSLLALCQKALKPDVLKALETKVGYPLQRKEVAQSLPSHWLYRLLLMRQLEHQLVQWHGGDKAYRFLTPQQIDSWEQLEQLFFEVMPRAGEERSTRAFSMTPALPLPLFEEHVFEEDSISISSLPFPKKQGSKDLLATVLQGLGKMNAPFSQRPSPQGPPQELAASFAQKAMALWLQTKLNVECDSQEWAKIYKTLPSNEVMHYLDQMTICDPAAGGGQVLQGAFEGLVAAKHEWAYFGQRATPAMKRVCFRDGTLQTKKGEAFPYQVTAGPGGYNRQANKEMQHVYEAFFANGAHTLARQLFGVSSSAEALAQSKLRLWSALLRLAHYDAASGLEELPAIPDLAHHLCHGDTLHSRFNLETHLAKMLKGNKLRLGVYLSAIRMYQNSASPAARAEARGIFTDMQKNFRMELRRSLPAYQRLKRLENMQSLEANPLFDFAQTPEDQGKAILKAEQLRQKIARLRLQVAGELMAHQTFEWRYQFPEILNPQDGSFQGFDLLMTCPPEEEATAEERQRCGQLVELCLRLVKPDGFLALMLPDDFFRNKAYRTAVRALENQAIIHETQEVDGDGFGSLVTGKVLVWAERKQ